MQLHIPDPWHGVEAFGPPVIGMLATLLIICAVQWVAQQPVSAGVMEPVDPMAMRMVLGVP